MSLDQLVDPSLFSSELGTMLSFNRLGGPTEREHRACTPNPYFQRGVLLWTYGPLREWCGFGSKGTNTSSDEAPCLR